MVDLKGIEPSNLTDANRALYRMIRRPKNKIKENVLIYTDILRKSKLFYARMRTVRERETNGSHPNLKCNTGAILFILFTPHDSHFIIKTDSSLCHYG